MSFLKSVTSQVEDTEVVSSLTFPQIVVSFKFCRSKWTDLTQDCILGMLFCFFLKDIWLSLHNKTNLLLNFCLNNWILLTPILSCCWSTQLGEDGWRMMKMIMMKLLMGKRQMDKDFLLNINLTYCCSLLLATFFRD